MIIDDHEISRAAIRELLRAEGMDVTADFKATPHALTAARALNPEMVIVDVTPMAGTGFSIARGLSGLPAPPVVILTSSTPTPRSSVPSSIATGSSPKQTSLRRSSSTSQVPANRPCRILTF